MKSDNPDSTYCEEVISRRRANLKAVNGHKLSENLKILHKKDLRKARRGNHFKPIPESHYIDLLKLGRSRYRAIVVSTYLSLFWDGWKSKKTTRRKPNNKVMMTRRMLSQHFKINECTAGKALNDLVAGNFITVAQKPVYSGRQGQNLGTLYRLPWMENPKGKSLHIYWGLLVSEAFIQLSVTLQAVIILLHRLHNRKQNVLTIRPGALQQYGIHRNRLPKYISQLMNAGLLEYLGDYDYAFRWFDLDGKPEFTRLKLKSTHQKYTATAPNVYQGVVNE